MSLHRNLRFATVLLALNAAACNLDAGADGAGLERAASSSASALAVPTVPQPTNAYTLFETLQVRPLALAPNGKLLFALNTPDNRLEIFRVSKDGLELRGSVEVGLEPIAVAARSQSEVWVVNHLSDSVSVVKIGSGHAARVVRTLHVGDEPRDIVFGGPDGHLAFVTTAHRGQNSAESPDLFNPAAGRADVWVFDAEDLGTEMGGRRLSKLTFFADTPRALSVSADGSRVYAAAFFSGNETTVVSKEAVATVYASSFNPADPFFFTHFGSRQPLTARVVKRKLGGDGGYHWYDDLGTNFDVWVRVSLPDQDVFTIDASQYPPVAMPAGTFAHVGTTLFNMAVNPVSGKVYVSNTDAHNDVRFEGHNPELGTTSVRGRIVDSRISVLDPQSGSIVHNDLNRHIVDGEGDASLSRAFPQDMAVSSDGATLLVAAQGSGKLGIYATSELEAGTAMPSLANQVQLSAGGPTGVVLDGANARAYVLTRFDNGVSTVALASRTETSHLQMHSPEAEHLAQGRRFLYDAAFTSENGTQACASCHVGGDLDALAWDLGNPGGSSLPISRMGEDDTMFTFDPEIIMAAVPTSVELFDAYLPIKGPMTTQSLRGLDNHGSMHWRGDRNGAIKQDGTPFLDGMGMPVISEQPNSGIFDELQAFVSFNVAFPGLVGRGAPLTDIDMAAFADFALDVSYPPNPIRALDDSLTPTEAAGRAIYFQTTAGGDELPVDRLHNCNGCHTLDPSGNAGSTDHPGFFGSKGRLSFENLPQIFKVAHFRNMYQKVGMFASAPDSNRAFTPSPALNPPLPAVRGFGVQPDGAVGSVEHHLTGRVFIRTTNPNAAIVPNPGGLSTFKLNADGDPLPVPDPLGFSQRRALASFLLAYDSNMKPVVGQQLTLVGGDSAPALARLALLEARATAGECDLIVKGRVGPREKGFVYEAGAFRSDIASEAPRSEATLLASIVDSGNALTFTCVPPGSGFRAGIDRDSDGFADGDELAAGTDPASASSHP